MDEDVNTRANHRPDSDRQPLALATDFRIVAEDAPVMLWLTNAEGKVVFTNSKWLKFVGGPPGDPVGGDAWVKALHPDDLESCMRIFEEAFAAHQSFEMEYRLRRADGQYRYVLDTGEPYISKEGKFAGFIGSSADITDRKNHENQLRVSQQELTQHNLEMQFINELNSYPQVCRSLEETHPIVAHYARRIFADCTGRSICSTKATARPTWWPNGVMWNVSPPGRFPPITAGLCGKAKSTWSMGRRT